jgi:hypothetical protein
MTVESERRRSRRFAVSILVRTTNPAQGNVVGKTRDISWSGAAFYIESDLWKEGASIEFVVQLPSEVTLAKPASVLCTGRIMRVEQLNGQVGLAVQTDSFSVLQRQ